MAKDDKDKAASTEETPKKSKKKLIIIIVAVLALAGGGFGGYTMFKPKKATAEPALVAGPIVGVLEAITINLADGHYLKLKISLQTTADVAEAPDGSKALDIAIDEFSNRPMAELMSNDARNTAKTDLKTKIIKAYKVAGVAEVCDVYFTSFVIQ